MIYVESEQHQVSRSDESTDEGAGAENDLEFNMTDIRNLGVVLHSFTSGYLIGTAQPLISGVLMGYLNLPAYLAVTAGNMSILPLAFSFLWGLISDSKPICGRRRKPYMIIGWGIVCLSLLSMAVWPMPAPYYCVGSDGEYDMSVAPCNPKAPAAARHLMPGLCGINLGIAIADAAASALLIEYAKRETEELRGSAQTSLQMVKLLGTFCSTLVSAFAFNGKLYTGTFDQDHQLSFQSYVWVSFVTAIVTFCLCCFYVREPPLAGRSVVRDLESDSDSSESDVGLISFRGLLRSVWVLLRTRSFFFVAMYVFWNSTVHLKTPALQYVRLQWAGVHMMQSSLVSLLGVVLSALGIWIARTYLLNAGWRTIILIVILSNIIFDAIPQFLTILDVIRNQYFYLGEPLTEKILESGRTLVFILLGNEVADASNAGLVHGLIATLALVAAPLSSAFSVQVFQLFGPELSSRNSYVEDSETFRRTVALSALATYLFSLASLLLLPLLPQQKADTQRRKREWGGSSYYAYATVSLLILGLIYCLLVDFLSLSPTLACLRFVGGSGCSSSGSNMTSSGS